MCGCWGLIGVTLGVAAEQRGVYDRVMSHKNPQQSQFTIRKTTKHPSYAVKCILFQLYITAQFTVQSMAHGATVHPYSGECVFHSMCIDIFSPS